ncbi:hypothetical protein ACFL6C_01520 [Myxococcota bacterium]
MRGYCTVGNRRNMADPMVRDGNAPDGKSPQADGQDGSSNDGIGGDGSGGDAGDTFDPCPRFERDISISEASDLDEFAGLSCFDITGVLTIHSHTMTHVDALAGLESVRGDILVHRNDFLENLHGLANLEHVRNTLEITNNPSLTSLGLSSLFFVGDNLTITNNSVLPTSQAEALADQAFVMGTTTIDNNGPD